jgi:dTDP-4-dehydrorhamnose reductase
MPNKILIIGRNGQVGWELRRTLSCLGQIVAVEYPEIDLTNPESLRTVVAGVKPTVIANAAAYTAVDKAETETALAEAINATGPAVLAEEAKKIGALLVHYSTDYVFDGAGNDERTETSPTGPLNVYGKTKLAGDQAIAASGCDHLIFRTSWVYGARGANFLLTMLKLAKERESLSIVSDQVGAPTTSVSIAQATAAVLAQVLAPGKGIDGRSGVYNLTNGGEASWFDFAKTIFAKSHMLWDASQPTLTPIPTSAFPRPARRPLNSRLSGEKLEKIFGVTLPHWEAALDLTLETLAEQKNFHY